MIYQICHIEVLGKTIRYRRAVVSKRDQKEIDAYKKLGYYVGVESGNFYTLLKLDI